MSADLMKNRTRLQSTKLLLKKEYKGADWHVCCAILLSACARLVRAVSTRTHTKKQTNNTCLCSDTPPSFYTSTEVLVPFHRSAPSRSEPSEDGLAWAETHRESVKISRLSVSQSAQNAEQSGTAALSLFLSSIDCVNGCHWRWRDRQAAFVGSTAQSCGGLTLSWCEAEGCTSM